MTKPNEKYQALFYRQYYMSRSILPLCGGMMLGGGVAALIILAHPVGMMLYAVLAVALAIGLGMTRYLAVADVINFENKYHDIRFANEF